MGLDDVVDAQSVDVGAGAGVEGPGGHLARDFRHGVGVLGDDRVLLVDRDVAGLAVAAPEADAVGRLGGGEHDLADAEGGGGLEDVVVREDVGRVGGLVGGEQRSGDRGEVDDRVVGRAAVRFGAGVVVVGLGRDAGQRGVHLAGVGEVHPQVGDSRVAERGEVGVGDLVALGGEVGRDVVPGLAAAAGEEDPHGARVKHCRRAGARPADRGRPHRTTASPSAAPRP